MLFSSSTFIYLFLPIVLLAYFVLFRWSRKLQNIFLLIASLFFYAWGEPKFVLVMITSITLNWLIGLLVDRCRHNKLLCRGLIATDVVLNLSLLFVFKYLGFACQTANSLFGAQWTVPSIALPIGISFFTFQAMSYVIDVYREKGEVQKDLLCVGLYISFFPQLIAGPIVRYQTVAHEIRNRKETAEDFFDGFARFIIGLGKKVLLSNSFAFLADQAFNSAADGAVLSVGFSWIGALAYTLQIFFDFGGYSDMAIGLGRMFGFHFLENFDYPYISTSITEFWRRWHMSLGTWFRDYVYIPLGGSRVNKGRQIFNLFVVWFLTGIWHGANFTFILWGLMYFVLLTVEKTTGWHKPKGMVLTAVKWVYTMLFVILGWVLFRADTVTDAWHYLGSMFGVGNVPLFDGAFTASLRQNLILLVLGAVLSAPVVPLLKKKFGDTLVWNILSVIGLVGLFTLSVASLISSSYNPFIYFNF